VASVVFPFDASVVFPFASVVFLANIHVPIPSSNSLSSSSFFLLNSLSKSLKILLTSTQITQVFSISYFFRYFLNFDQGGFFNALLSGPVPPASREPWLGPMTAADQYLDTVLTHVFMPPSLPTRWGSDDEKAECQSSFFNLFRTFLQDLTQTQHGFDPPILDKLITSLDTVLHVSSERDILTRLNGLPQNDLWLYLRSQTCLLHFQEPQNGQLIISGYDLQASKGGCAGEIQHPFGFDDDPVPLVSNVAMPRLSVVGCKEQVTQTAFALQLAEIKASINLPGSFPETKKGGQVVEEERLLPMPVYVFQWLLPFVTVSSAAEIGPDPFFKKVSSSRF